MPRKPVVGGNWKCNPKSLADVTALLSEWKAKPFDKRKVDVIVLPIMPHIAKFKKQLEKLGVSVCAQNCSKTDLGAFTGEVSASQLSDAGVGWTLIGHSERRSKYGETDEDTAVKVEMALKAGLKVILAIGEQLEERESGKTDEVNQRMLAAVLPKIGAEQWNKIVIAYEPVWAIGTGKVATPDQAEETHAAIRAYLAKAVSEEVAEKVRIQYGGSVTPENCEELIKKPNVDGFLVGGASLKGSFMDIVLASIPAKPLKKPKFGKVSGITPDQKGVNVMVKCVKAAEAVAGTEGLFEAVVGDDSGTVTLSLRSKELCDLCTPDASLRIQNASAKMVKGHIRLVIDKWAAFKPADAPLDIVVSTKNDISATEYELVES
mmetsp:Transcript_63030/g.136884  ORF Transcript_63030/g.136884 Transcript_63030/m.136884 type:complete len:377 (+) Transcript_63030:51-1181(+)|eukprot:CAMPEP_0170607974 /NCGR_PEP_ID=MMETSP0224-20130122/21340_1 /TAXON_ID=285029 /ORGANISM="Togula jolla, Strain CCCM 725" /LENGTH=376 /DNA_ID=CAMNT_0010933175 /DNA_START=51 /DNA_END=1181 /DNA_ORIENTATION=-